MQSFNPSWISEINSLFQQNTMNYLKDELSFLSNHKIFLKECQNQLSEYARINDSVTVNSLFVLFDSMEHIMKGAPIIPLSAIETLKVLPYLQNCMAGLVASSFERAIPYMNSTQAEEYQEEVLPKLKEPIKKKLTISDILTIISLLVTIYFGIISSITDDQLDRISQQNEAIIQQNNLIIEQQQDLIKLEKEDKELWDTLNSLADSINILTDEVKSLRDEIEQYNNLSELNRQVNTENG